MSTLREKYIFLGGHRKCGTTMFLNLLDNHEQCCVYPTDISILYGYFPVYTQENFTNEERIERLKKVIFGSLKKFQTDHGVEHVFSVSEMEKYFFNNLDINKLMNIQYIIHQMVASFRKITGKTIEKYPYVILKETSLEIYALELSKIFVDSKFVELIRDPRDNYAALLAGAEKHYKKFGESEKNLLMSLLHRVGLSSKLSSINKKIIGENRFLSLRFEDITTELENYIQILCDFIGIRKTETMMTPTVMGYPTEGNNYDGDKFTKVTTRNVGRWQERIGEFETKILEYYLKDMMIKNKYTLKFSEFEQAKAAAEFYKWSNYHYFFKDSFKEL